VKFGIHAPNVCALLALTWCTTPGRADVLLSNFAAAASPPGTFLGVGSSTVYKAAGFAVTQSYALTSVKLSMSFAGGGVGIVSVWEGPGTPQVRLMNLSGPPQVGTGDFVFTPPTVLTLTPGSSYWVIVESVSNPTGSFIWDGTSPPTQPTGSATFLGFLFNGTPSPTPNRLEVSGDRVGGVCYANCDGSTTQPVLTGNDFQCFLASYAQGLSYANCDNSTSQPILNANDFLCFLNAFVAGCT
jgi:hypothetical protein